jgi:hypothetical protein
VITGKTLKTQKPHEACWESPQIEQAHLLCSPLTMHAQACKMWQLGCDEGALDWSGQPGGWPPYFPAARNQGMASKALHGASTSAK